MTKHFARSDWFWRGLDSSRVTYMGFRIKNVNDRCVRRTRYAEVKSFYLHAKSILHHIITDYLYKRVPYSMNIIMNTHLSRKLLGKMFSFQM